MKVFNNHMKTHTSDKYRMVNRLLERSAERKICSQFRAISMMEKVIILLIIFQLIRAYFCRWFHHFFHSGVSILYTRYHIFRSSYVKIYTSHVRLCTFKCTAHSEMHSIKSNRDPESSWTPDRWDGIVNVYIQTFCDAVRCMNTISGVPMCHACFKIKSEKLKMAVIRQDICPRFIKWSFLPFITSFDTICSGVFFRMVFISWFNGIYSEMSADCILYIRKGTIL